MMVREPDQLLETGWSMPGHAHPFDHTTWFIMGLWKVTCWDWDESTNAWATEPCVKELIIRGGMPGARLLIKADRKHQLEVLKGPANYACAFPNRNKDGEIVPFYTGWLDGCQGLEKPLRFSDPPVQEFFKEYMECDLYKSYSASR